MNWISNAFRTIAGIALAIVAIPVTLAIGLFTFLGVLLAGLTMALSLRTQMPSNAGGGSKSATIDAHRAQNGRYEV